MENINPIDNGIVSVLVPLYNHQRTVTRALKSLLSSDCSKIELLICDDASSDHSFECARDWIARNSFRFHRALLLKNEINIGITGNLNRLVQSARGEFLTDLASDDMLAPGAIDIQREYLQTNTDKDFVFANAAYIDSADNVLVERIVSPNRARSLKKRWCRDMDLVNNWGFPWLRLFGRRTAFLKFGPYISEHSFEDRWCALNILQTGRYNYLDEVVYYYRDRGPGTGTAGIKLEIMARDLIDVERRSLVGAKGALWLLLFIRVKAFRREGPWQAGRWPWLLIRRSVEKIHSILVEL